MPHVIGLTIGRATSSPSNDVPAKHKLCAPFTINISLNCTCQANWMATTSQTNISESFNSIHISSTLSDLFQFVSFLSQRESNGFAAGHAGQPKTKWVMRRVQATKPWPEWKILSVTCANSNTKTWETQKHERTLCCAISMCTVYTKSYQIMQHVEKGMRLLPITLETFLYLLLSPFCNLSPLPFGETGAN